MWCLMNYNLLFFNTIYDNEKQINGKRWHSNNNVHSFQSESQSSRSYLTGVTTKINSSASPAFPFDSKLTSNWLNVAHPKVKHSV